MEMYHTIAVFFFLIFYIMINCNIVSFFHRGYQSKTSLTSSADVLIGYTKYIIVNILILPTYLCMLCDYRPVHCHQ